MRNPENTEIIWHPGFYGAAELEFLENKKDLDFLREYNLSKEPIRMDLLVIKKLSDARQLTEPGDRNNADAVLQVSVSANRKIYERIRRQEGIMCDALRELFKEDFDKMQADHEKEISKLREDNEKKDQTLLSAIKNLMESMKWTAEQAMSAMKIPEADRGKYMAKLQ